jgi:hypothetical protein
MKRERRKRVSFKTCKSHFSLREEKVLLPSNFRGTQSTTKKKEKEFSEFLIRSEQLQAELYDHIDSTKSNET